MIGRQENVQRVLDAIPLLFPILANRDNMLTARGASLCIERLSCAFSGPQPWQSSVIVELAGSGILDYWVHELRSHTNQSYLSSDSAGSARRNSHPSSAVARALGSGGTMIGILSSLVRMVSSAPAVLCKLYELDIASVLGDILDRLSCPPHAASPSSGMDVADDVETCLSITLDLATGMLPQPSAKGVASTPTSSKDQPAAAAAAATPTAAAAACCPQGPQSDWQCPHCTYINASRLAQCSMCMASVEGAEAIPLPSVPKIPHSTCAKSEKEVKQVAPKTLAEVYAKANPPYLQSYLDRVLPSLLRLVPISSSVAVDKAATLILLRIFAMGARPDRKLGPEVAAVLSKLLNGGKYAHDMVPEAVISIALQLLADDASSPPGEQGAGYDELFLRYGMPQRTHSLAACMSAEEKGATSAFSDATALLAFFSEPASRKRRITRKEMGGKDAADGSACLRESSVLRNLRAMSSALRAMPSEAPVAGCTLMRGYVPPCDDSSAEVGTKRRHRKKDLTFSLVQADLVARNPLKALAHAFDSSEGVTAFEMEESGMLEALLQFLRKCSTQTPAAGEAWDGDSRGVRSFCEAFLPDGSPRLLRRLAETVHGCLTAAEARMKEPLVVLQGGSTQYSRMGALLAPFRVKVSPSPSLSSSGEAEAQILTACMSSIPQIVLVEPLTTLTEMCTFLEKHIQQAVQRRLKKLGKKDSSVSVPAATSASTAIATAHTCQGVASELNTGRGGARNLPIREAVTKSPFAGPFSDARAGQRATGGLIPIAEALQMLQEEGHVAEDSIARRLRKRQRQASAHARGRSKGKGKGKQGCGVRLPHSMRSPAKFREGQAAYICAVGASGRPEWGKVEVVSASPAAAGAWNLRRVSGAIVKDVLPSCITLKLPRHAVLNNCEVAATPLALASAPAEVAPPIPSPDDALAGQGDGGGLEESGDNSDSNNSSDEDEGDHDDEDGIHNGGDGHYDEHHEEDDEDDYDEDGEGYDGDMIDNCIYSGVPLLRRSIPGMADEDSPTLTRQRLHLRVKKSGASSSSAAAASASGASLAGSGAAAGVAKPVSASEPTSGHDSLTPFLDAGASTASARVAAKSSGCTSVRVLSWTLRYSNAEHGVCTVGVSSIPQDVTMFEASQILLEKSKNESASSGVDKTDGASRSHRTVEVSRHDWAKGLTLEFSLQMPGESDIACPKEKITTSISPAPLRVLPVSAAPTDAPLVQALAEIDLPGHFATPLRLLAALRAICESSTRNFGVKGAGGGGVVNLPNPKALVPSSPSLSAKLARQCADAVTICSGSIPEWCTSYACAVPSMLSLESRAAFFERASFGVARAIDCCQKAAPRIEASESSSRGVQQSPSLMMQEGATTLSQHLNQLGRLQRLRVSLNRSHVLESAEVLFETLVKDELAILQKGRSAARIEVDFDPNQSSGKVDDSSSGDARSGGPGLEPVLLIDFDEEMGHGTGPTQEFFSIICREFQREGLGIWRGDTRGVKPKASETEVQSYLHSSCGLFPAPLDLRGGSDPSLVLSRFRLLGRVIAKCLKDGRFLDLPLSLPLCAHLTSRGPLSIWDVLDMDEALGKSLLHIRTIVQRLSSADKIPPALEEEVKDLCLSWTLPGYPSYHLRAEGGSTGDAVSAVELEEWLESVVRHSLVTSVSAQVRELLAGVSDVMDASHLRTFTPLELQTLLCGGLGGAPADEAWSVQTISSSIVAGHGYTAGSQQVKDLIEIMSGFDRDQRRQFLSFVTGSPRLPVGGFVALAPRLTVVRKEVPEGKPPDNFLPSCSTCQVYLKLPAYSCKEIMQSQLLIAISDGLEYFALD